MKSVTGFLLALFISGGVYSALAQKSAPQEKNTFLFKPCGTQIKWGKYLESIGQRGSFINCPTFGICDKSFSRDTSIPGGITPVKKIHLFFHCFRNDEGLDGITADQIDTLMMYANADFSPYKIQCCYSAEFIDNTYYMQWDTTKDAVMRNTYAKNPAQQFNIYVVDMSSLGWSGLGTFPWDPSALTNTGNGIILDIFAVKVTQHLLTHELGHCLGLWHPFHGIEEMPFGCTSACYEKVEYSAAQRDSVGDFCSDTEPTPVNFTCTAPSGNDTCSSGNPTWSVTNNTNFMGYYADSCRDNFTAQQAGRIHCWIWDVFSGYLTYGTTICGSGAPPIADFYSILRKGCSPLTVNFVNTSSSSATSWLWDFGDAGTSTAENPSHTYMSEGNYDVKLTATNADGSRTETKNNYIIVSDTTSALSYSQDFESSVFPPFRWTFVNTERDAYTWQRSTSETPEAGFPCFPGDDTLRNIIGDNGLPTAAAVVPYSAVYDNTGYSDGLISPPFDFTWAKNPLLTFSIAYQQWDTAYDNRFKVFYTTDCGTTYNLLYDKAGDVLASVSGPAYCKFIPDSASDWRKDSIDLSALIGQPKVQFKFEFISGWDNYLYMDNININISNAGIENTNKVNLIPNLFPNIPNPFSESTTLHFETVEKGIVKLEIRNMFGQQVLELINGEWSKGNHTYTLTQEKTKSLPAGIYYCILKTHRKTSAIKMVLNK